MLNEKPTPALMRACLQFRNPEMLPFMDHLDGENQHLLDQLTTQTDPATIYRLQGRVQALRDLKKFIAEVQTLASNAR